MKNKIIIIISTLLIVVLIAFLLLHFTEIDTSAYNNSNSSKPASKAQITILSDDTYEALLSQDTSSMEISDTYYRQLTDGEKQILSDICLSYDIDIYKADTKFDVTTDNYVILSGPISIYIDLDSKDISMTTTDY